MAMRLDAVMNLQTAGFTGPLGGVTSGLGGLVGKLAGLAAGALSVAAVIRGLKGALDMGGELTDMSARTGVGVRDLVILKQAFQDVGLGADSVGPSINLMQKALTGVNDEGEPTNKMFARLGLSLEQLRGMSAMDQFKTIGASIGALGSEGERTAASMAIFGRSGGGMKALFADPQAIEKTTAALGSMPDVMAKNAAAFDMIGDRIGQMKTKMTGLWAGVLEGMAPALDSMTEAMNGIDLAGLGVKIGNVIGILIEAFKSGQIGEMLWLSLQIGFNTLINYLVGTLGNGNFWKGIGLIIAGAFTGLGGILLKILLTPLSYLQAAYDQWIAGIFETVGKIPGLGKALGLAGYKNEKTYKERVAENQNSSFLKDAAEFSTKLAGEELAAGGKLIAGSIRDGQLVNNDESLSKLGGIVSGLQASLDKNKAALNAKAGGVALPTAGVALAPGEKKMKAQESNVDRFAKIGWFVGSGGSASTDYSRRTAGNTGLMVGLLRKIAGQSTWSQVQPAVVSA
ncbi:MAG: hypothetical protein ACOYOU_00845 [Kiritimatiellia bacterium]